MGSSPTSGTIQIQVMNVKEIAEHYGKERQLVKLAEECCKLAEGVRQVTSDAPFIDGFYIP